MSKGERRGEEDTDRFRVVTHTCKQVHRWGTLSIDNQIHYVSSPQDGEVREWTEELQVHKPILIPSEERKQKSFPVGSRGIPMCHAWVRRAPPGGRLEYCC